jgi:(2Fe-2S) ferredoxin
MATVEVRAEAPVKYVSLTPEKMAQVVREHICGGRAVMDSALAAGCETTG